MKKYFITKIILTSLALTSCSSLSEKDCNELNWFDRGRTDIRSGANFNSKLADYKKSCGKHGVSVGESEYMKGVTYAGAIKCTGYKSFHDGKWRSVGIGDALLGRANTHLKKHALSCNTYKIRPDSKEYYKGFQIGLKQFCTYENGLKYGKSGEDYKETCPRTSNHSFKKGFEVGHVIYIADMARFKVEQETKKQDELFDEIVELTDEIKELKYKLQNFDRDEDREIADIEREIRDKKREIRFAELDNKPTSSIKALELELARIEDRLDSSRRNFDDKRRSLESEIKLENSKLRRLELKYRSYKSKISRLEERAKEAELNAKRVQNK